MQDVRGKVAVVTGSGSGIGLGMARAFADAGMKVIIADVVQEKIDAAVDELTTAGHEVVGVRTDVSRLADVEALAEAPDAPKYFVPFRVTGPKNFVLFSVWTLGDQDFNSSERSS